MGRNPLTVAAALLLVGVGAGCAIHNQFGRPIRIERHRYASQGEQLEYLVGVGGDADLREPIAVLLEGDGSRCQEYRESLWRRFLTRHTGRFLLVRPRTFVNTVCGTARFARADFIHRLAELADLLAEVELAYPRRPVFLIGHSAGAHLAIMYASAHPGAIAGIVDLGGGTWPLADLLPEIAREKARRGRLTSSELTEQLDGIETLLARVRTNPNSLEPMWGRTVRFWYQMFFSQVRELWAATPVPVLILHGSEDLDSVPVSAVLKSREEFQAAGKASVRFVFLDGEGHDLLNAKAFALIDAWIASQGL